MVGMMGCGKSTVGREVAGRIGREFRDADTVVEAMAGCSVPRIFAEAGEAAFRRWEKRAVAALEDLDGVVATGGGVVLDPDNVEVMRRSGVVVWLDAPAEALIERLADADDRPLLAGPDREATIRRLWETRRPWYLAAAHHTVDAGRPVSEVVEEVVALWEGT